MYLRQKSYVGGNVLLIERKKEKSENIIKNHIIDNKFSKKGKEKYHFSHKFSELLNFLEIFKNLNTDKDNILFFIAERMSRGLDVYNKLITFNFQWPRSKTKRLIDKLSTKNREFPNPYIEKIKVTCPCCHKKYERIPKHCKRCSEILVHQHFEFTNNLEYPQFLLKLTDDGFTYVMDKITTYNYILRLYSEHLRNQLTAQNIKITERSLIMGRNSKFKVDN